MVSSPFGRATLLAGIVMLGCILKPVIRVAKHNQLMLAWIHSVTELGEGDLHWAGRLTDSSRGRFLVLANRFDKLCQAALPEQDAACLWAAKAKTVTAGDSEDALGRIKEYEQSAVEQAMMAAFVGDAAYANKDRDTAIKIWREYLPPSALIYKAQIAADQEDYQMAAALLAGLDRVDPLDLDPLPRQRFAQILVVLARFNQENGDFAEAEYYWRWAIRQSPERAGYYNGLGRTLARQARWEEAIAAYQRAIELDPTKPGYYAGLAQAFISVGETEQALTAVQRLLELDPDNITGQRLLQRLKPE
jgi:tetratricopeptide (TPR) repeat protein